MLYRVRNGYAVHLGNGKTFGEGEIFEPSPEVLQNQSWKIEPVQPEPEGLMAQKAPERQEAIDKVMEAPPRDRMIKKPPVKKARGKT